MIYGREKVLLETIKRVPNKKVYKIQLVKLLFLLKNETSINREVAFYDFLPYKYGPFSFTVYRDIDELKQMNLIEFDDDNMIMLSELGYRDYGTKKSIIDAIDSILDLYGKLEIKDLIDYVYKKYPWYAAKSEITSNNHKYNIPTAANAIYTLGYEGLSIDSFLNILLRAGINAVIDVRNNPISHKYGFSKPNLEKRCKDVGLKYYHFPQVGITSRIRNQVHERYLLWDIYREDVIPNAIEDISKIERILTNKPSVMICFEKDPQNCHRHILAEEICKRTRLPIINYRSEGKVWLKN